MILDITLPDKFPTVILDSSEYLFHLEKEGFEYKIYDLNYRFWELILTKEYLKNSYTKISYLQKIIHLLSTIASKRKRYRFLAENLKEATDRLKQPQIFNKPKEYLESIYIIHNTLELISLSFKGAYLTPRGFTIPSLNTDSSLEILKFAKDLKNPYLAFLKEFVAELADLPKIVCINLYSHQNLLPAMTLSLLLKEREPKIHISITNHWWENFTLLTNIKRLKEKKVFFEVFDTVVLYQEQSTKPILSLIHAIITKQDFSTIPNLAGRKEGGEIFINVPEKNFERIEGTKKIKELSFTFPLISSPIYSTRITIRKCSWSSCTFCVQNIKYLKRQQVDIYQDIEKFIEKARELKRYGIRHYIFRDEGFCSEEIKYLSSLILKEGLNIFWSARAVLDKAFDKKMCHFIASSGCKEIFFGIESINQRVGMLMNKRGADAKERKEIIRHVASNFNEAGIGLHLCIIGGFPTETEEELSETMDFLFKIIEENNHFSFSLNYFALFLGSSIFNNPSYYHIKEIVTKPTDDIKIEYPFIMEKGYPSRERIKNFFFKKREEFYRRLGYYTIDHVKENPFFLDSFLYFIENSGHGLFFKCNFRKDFIC